MAVKHKTKEMPQLEEQVDTLIKKHIPSIENPQLKREATDFVNDVRLRVIRNDSAYREFPKMYGEREVQLRLGDETIKSSIEYHPPKRRGPIGKMLEIIGLAGRRKATISAQLTYGKGQRDIPSLHLPVPRDNRYVSSVFATEVAHYLKRVLQNSIERIDRSASKMQPKSLADLKKLFEQDLIRETETLLDNYDIEDAYRKIPGEKTNKRLRRIGNRYRRVLKKSIRKDLQALRVVRKQLEQEERDRLAAEYKSTQEKLDERSSKRSRELVESEMEERSKLAAHYRESRRKNNARINRKNRDLEEMINKREQEFKGLLQKRREQVSKLEREIEDLEGEVALRKPESLLSKLEISKKLKRIYPNYTPPGYNGGNRRIDDSSRLLYAGKIQEQVKSPENYFSEEEILKIVRTIAKKHEYEWNCKKHTKNGMKNIVQISLDLASKISPQALNEVLGGIKKIGTVKSKVPLTRIKRYIRHL